MFGNIRNTIAFDIVVSGNQIYRDTASKRFLNSIEKLTLGLVKFFLPPTKRDVAAEENKIDVIQRMVNCGPIPDVLQQSVPHHVLIVGHRALVMPIG